MLKNIRASITDAKSTQATIVEMVKKENRSMTKDEIKQFDNLSAEIETNERALQVDPVTAVVTAPVTAKVDDNVQMRSLVAQRALAGGSENTGADGKFTVPNAFSMKLFKLLGESHSLLTLLMPMNVSSDVLDYPRLANPGRTLGDTKDLKQAKQLDAVADGKMTFANVQIAIATYGVSFLLSNQLIADTKVDLNGTMLGLAGQGIGRNMAKDAITALKTAVTPKPSAGATHTYAELLALVGAVDGAYQSNAKFVMNFKTALGLLALEDGNKRPLLQSYDTDLFDNGVNFKLFGKVIYIEEALTDGEIYYGDFGTVVMATNTGGTGVISDPYSHAKELATEITVSARAGFAPLFDKTGSVQPIAGITPKP